ncbi:uncharacterized protein LOC143289758 [Babylonia areolata]|uniref:uncharacterized protein LOC143289758 n=1 Tax=Babylonia areolata TaxID=304850 RepID=UPI003FD57E49
MQYTMTDPIPEFKKFLTTCSSLLKAESPQFLGLIRKRYDSCSEDFRSSSDMVDLLNNTMSKMVSDQKRLFVHLKDFVTKLKAWSSQNRSTGASRKRKAEMPKDSVAKVARMEDSTSEGSDLEGKLHRALGSGSHYSSVHSTSAASEAILQRRSKSSSPASRSNPDCAGAEPLTSSRSLTASPDSVRVSSGTDSKCSEDSASRPHSSLMEGDCASAAVTTTMAEGAETCANNGSGGHEIHNIPPQEVDVSCSLLHSGPASSHPGSPRPPSSLPTATAVKGEVREVCGETLQPQTNGSIEVCGEDEDKKVNSDLECLAADKKTRATSSSKSVDVKRITPQLLSHSTSNTSSGAANTPCAQSSTTHSAVLSSPHAKGKSLGDAIDRLKNKLTSQPTAVTHTTPSSKTVNGKVGDEEDDTVTEVKVVHHRHSEKHKKSVTVCKQSSERVGSSTSEASGSGGGKSAGGSRGEHSCSRSKETEMEEGEEGGGKGSKTIRRLERLLEKIRDEIEKVREKDLSLDDLNESDSAYIYEDRLQKKFVKVWDRLCQLKGCTKSSGRPIERKFKYEGTRFPEINRKIEKFVNRPNSFPDYHDVRGIIKKVNTRWQLGLNVMQINSISKETFMDVGEALQRRRQADFISTFHSKQTIPYCTGQDPAMFDEELRQKLEENGRVGRSRLEGVIRKYTDLQLALGDDNRDEGDRDRDRDASTAHHHGDKFRSHHNAKSHSDHNSGSLSHHQSKCMSDHESKSQSDHESKSQSDHESKSQSDQESKSQSDQESKSQSDHETKSVSDNNSASASEHHSDSLSDGDGEEDEEAQGKVSPQVIKAAKVVLTDCMEEEEEEEEDVEEEDMEEEEEEEDAEEEDNDGDLNMIEMDIAEECHLLMGGDDNSQDSSEWRHEFGDNWQQQGNNNNSSNNNDDNTATWQPDHDDSTGSWPEDHTDKVSWPSQRGDNTNSVELCDAVDNDSITEGDNSVRLLEVEPNRTHGTEWLREGSGGDEAAINLTENTGDDCESLPITQSENSDRRPWHTNTFGSDGKETVRWKEQVGDNETVWIEENDEDSCEQPEQTSTATTTTTHARAAAVALATDRTAEGASRVAVVEHSAVSHHPPTVVGIVREGEGGRGGGESVHPHHRLDTGVIEVYEEEDVVKVKDAVMAEGVDGRGGSGTVVDSSVGQDMRTQGACDQSEVIDLDAGVVVDPEEVTEDMAPAESAVGVRQVGEEVSGGGGESRTQQVRENNCVPEDSNACSAVATDGRCVISHVINDDDGSDAVPEHAATAPTVRTLSPDAVHTLKTGSLHVTKKSSSPVKVNPDLRLPACFQQRNSDKVFYPDRSRGYVGVEQNGDSITIGSSDEETEVKAVVKGRTLTRSDRCTVTAARPEDGDVIVLSDDD